MPSDDATYVQLNDGCPETNLVPDKQSTMAMQMLDT